MTDWRFTEKLFLAENEGEVLSLLKDLCGKVGFEAFGFALKYQVDFLNKSPGKTYIAHTYESTNLKNYYGQLQQSDVANQDARVQCSLLGNL